MIQKLRPHTARDKARQLVEEQRIRSGRIPYVLDQTPMVFGRGTIVENTILHVATDIVIQDRALVSGHIKTPGSVTIIDSEFDGLIECSDLAVKGDSVAKGYFIANRAIVRDIATVHMKGHTDTLARKESGLLRVTLDDRETCLTEGQDYCSQIASRKEKQSRHQLSIVG